MIERLTQDCDAKRQAIVQPLLEKLNGKLTEAERKYLEKAFQRLQNQLLDGPISAADRGDAPRRSEHPGGTRCSKRCGNCSGCTSKRPLAA